MSASGQSNTLVTRLLELARRDPKYLEDLEKFRRTIAVMFTDIRGSTAYFEKHGDVAGLMLVHECNTMVRRMVQKHGGRVIKTIGDGCMATFDDCPQAVAAAVQMQLAMADMNSQRSPDEQVAIRIGLHYGSGIVKSRDVFGDVVNMASRVESVATPGQVVISAPLCEQVTSFGFRISELGRFALKGKSGEQLLYEVIWKGATTHGSSLLPAAVPEPAPPSYMLQVMKQDGSIGAEYQLKSALTIGRSQGDIRFPSDANMSAVHARISLDEGQVLVEDISQGGESVFLRLSAAYTLQDGDIVIMGNQAFRFNEDSMLMSAATVLGASLPDITRAAEDAAAAEFVRLDAAGAPSQHYPLRNETTEFGRTTGTYTFGSDKLMSRVHARVLQRGEDFVLEDAGSRNGTFVKVRGKSPVPVGAAVLVGSRLLKLIERS